MNDVARGQVLRTDLQVIVLKYPLYGIAATAVPAALPTFVLTSRGTKDFVTSNRLHKEETKTRIKKKTQQKTVGITQNLKIALKDCSFLHPVQSNFKLDVLHDSIQYKYHSVFVHLFWFITT